jgi:hypothetical protein
MVIKEALDFLESAEMREFLQNPEVGATSWQWVMLVAQSRASLENKAAVLKQIAERYPAEDWHKWYNPGVMAEQAFRALEETKLTPPGSVFILNHCILDDDIVWNNDEFLGHYIKKYAEPFATFAQAIAHIEKEYEYEEGEEVESAEFCSWYEITRWDMNESGNLSSEICWILDDSDVVWRNIIWGYMRDPYLGNPKRDDTNFEIGYRHDLNLPVPFTFGDIITVDVRPFAEVFHAVIIMIDRYSDYNHDCCSPSCLFFNKQGKVYTGALKHMSFCLYPAFSPLLRAARYDGELPEWEAPLKIISECVKKDHTLGDRLMDLESKRKIGDTTWADIKPFFT